jgi:rhodanese-related sulfurtransferase
MHRLDADIAREVSADELDQMIEEHEVPVIIDVRSPNDYARGHIPAALNLSPDDLRAAARAGDPPRHPRLARNATLVTYSDHGARGAQAAALLRDLGFVRACNLVGGLDAWKARGFALIRDRAR